MVKGTHMRVTKKLLPGVVVAMAATTALALSACAPTTAAPDASGSGEAGTAEITVGVITSETGPLAGYGKQYLEGAALGEDELLAHARTELAGFKVPVRIAFVDALPRSTIEKLARSRLREQATALIKETAHEHH